MTNWNEIRHQVLDGIKNIGSSSKSQRKSKGRGKSRVRVRLLMSYLQPLGRRMLVLPLMVPDLDVEEAEEVLGNVTTTNKTTSNNMTGANSTR